MSRDIRALLVDCQGGFSNKVIAGDGSDPFENMRQQQVLRDGGLYVQAKPGEVTAEQSMKNTAEVISSKKGMEFEDVITTEDSHPSIHMSFCSSYKKRGENVRFSDWRKSLINRDMDTFNKFASPFTLMRTEPGNGIVSFDPVTNDITGEYECTVRPLQNWIENEYLPNLATDLCTWTPHCVVNTPGWLLQRDVFNAVHGWEEKNHALSTVLTKGWNLRVEQYSALEAEVPDPKDPSTSLNKTFIQSLVDCDEIPIMGLALNFCVARTMQSIKNFDESLVKKMVLLEDCTVEIAGFEHLTKSLMDEFLPLGMRISNSKDYVA